LVAGISFNWICQKSTAEFPLHYILIHFLSFVFGSVVTHEYEPTLGEVTNCISSQDVMSWTGIYSRGLLFSSCCFNNLTFVSNILKEQNTLC
jgi:hypothetical protein